MKRVIPVVVILVTILTVALYLKLREQRLAADRPSGGSATVEGVEVDVAARLAARVRVVHVRAGDEVKPGQVLVELDCAEPKVLLARAEAAVTGAQIALDAARTSVALSQQGVQGAQSQLAAARAAADAAAAQRRAAEVQKDAAVRGADRLKQVHLVGAVSDQKLDQTESQVAGLNEQLLALDASVNAARAQSAAAQSARQAAVIRSSLTTHEIRGAEQKVAAAQAARDRARIAVDECTLRAPRGGHVLERNFEPGEVVLPGSRVLTLVDIHEVTATFYLPNAELGAAAPGREVEVRPDGLPDRVLTGRIARVSQQAEFTPRNVQTRQDRDRLVYAVEVSVPNPEGLLRPGMPVEITVPGTRGPKP